MKPARPSQITLRSVMAALILAAGAAPLAATAANQDQNPPATTSAPDRPRIVTLQPGVRIDWSRRLVEVDATVILRQGLIELLACSPQMREHEAIVRIEARPLHVFMALGLIGLTPGHPPLYDDRTGRAAPAAGEPLEIDIRYTENGQEQTIPAERWLAHDDGRALIGRLPWVFAGSVELEDDSIAADYEGTVVAVVDFGSSLIALPEHHSDRNSELWLKPNTEAIPPLDTRCVLLIRRGAILLTADGQGRLRLSGRRVTLAGAGDRLKEIVTRPDRPEVRVRIAADCPESDRQAVLRLLESLDPDPDWFKVESAESAGPPAHNPDALIDWLTWRLRPYLERFAPTNTAPADDGRTGR